MAVCIYDKATLSVYPRDAMSLDSSLSRGVAFRITLTIFVMSAHGSRREEFRDQVPGHRLMRKQGGRPWAPVSGKKLATFQDFSSSKLCSGPTYGSAWRREKGMLERGFRVLQSTGGAGYKRGASNYL